MKIEIVHVLIILAILGGCKDNSQIPPEPYENKNLITNPTFQFYGDPSLQCWTVADDMSVQFSNDIPSGGSGNSLVLFNQIGAADAWPSNCIYTSISPPAGLHVYRISVLGKKKFDVGGLVLVDRNRPESVNAPPFAVLEIADTNWKLYSYTDTMRTTPSDTIFISLTGGSSENGGITYLNTCKLEKLD